MNPKLTVIVLLLLATAVPAWSQADIDTGELTGRITDASDARMPVSGAQVKVVNTKTGVNVSGISDQEGRYHLVLLPPGVYDLRVEMPGFVSQVFRGLPITVGQRASVDFELTVGAPAVVVDVRETLPLTDPERSHQSTTITENWIRQLPINRRDYLTYALLAPGIVDSQAFADANDYRIVQSEHSGLSFYGNNGRGNSVKLDGGEVDTAGGGVRPTLSQEAVQEFQINRGNYSAEFGGASGGVINIISKSGTNFFHGSVYDFLSNRTFDAADPFARVFINGQSQRIKPPSDRQQFGATIGGPLVPNRTFFFGAFEGLVRNESTSVPILTSPAIFDPTPQQEAILQTFAPEQATPLRQALTAPADTRRLFEANNGVFPFRSRDYQFSIRLDHNLSARNRMSFRYNYSNLDESNPNARALVGISRAYVTSKLDNEASLNWTYNGSARLTNQAHLQFDNYTYLVFSKDRFGPELNIDGFGQFNRDFTLPSTNILRREDFSDVISIVRGRHLLKVGGQALIRNTYSASYTLMGGRFNFGPLPGALLSPALATTTITSLQAFNLGLPQSYQQGFGNPVVTSTDPYFAGFIQDKWQPTRSLTIDLGLRYELDKRRDPVPTDKNNFAPRVGFAWNPGQNGKNTIRGAYGIYYSPQFYFVDWVVNALNDLNGHRQIAQVLTTIQTPGVASASNVFRTLRSQGVISLPFPTRTIAPEDIQQFGIQVVHDGPLPPLSVLYGSTSDVVNPYSQQASIGIEHAINSNFLITADYLFAHTLKIIRNRDDNLLPAPVDPTLGIPVWSIPYFKQPALLQDNMYESTGRAFYHGMTVELRRRFSDNFSLDANYTLSKAIDEVTDYNSDFQPNDQTNLRAERGLSSFDQRHKLVAYALLQSPAATQGLSRVFGNFVFTPIVRFNSGRPFNLLAGSDLNGDRHSTTDRPPFAGRNTGRGPAFWTFDTRLSRKIQFKEKVQIELMAEGFNLFNRLNYRSVNNIVGATPGPFDVQGRKDLNPSQPLGFTSAFDPRRMQFGFRLSF